MPYDPLFAPGPGSGLDHPASYWAATAGTIPADDGPLPARTETEVAIVGGCYTGLSCAYHLARQYGVRATVLEANRPGWGCSGRNGGFARMALGRYSAGQMLEMWGHAGARRAFGETMASLECVRGLIREGAIDCDASEAGHLKIAHRPGRAPELKAEAELLQREFEYPAQFLPAGELRDRHIAGTQSYGALRIPDALAVHPLKLALGVLRMARAAGAVVHAASPVIAWNKQGAEHRLATPRGEVRAKTVVIATNGYTPPMLHPAVRARLYPVLSHIIVTRPLTAAETRATGFLTRHVLTDTSEREWAKCAAISGMITGGLLFDQTVDFWGQTLTNLALWASLLYWLRRAQPEERMSLTVCVFYATLGEIFLSLVWGLYEYRLSNIPLFVPPGHALLFMLGTILARHARDWIVWVVPLAAAPFVLLLAVTGLGTLDALLFSLFLLCILSGRAGRLYAVMFVLSLAMEIYGTWLGNWTWAEEAPWLGFTTTNPPLAAGAFYCMLDMLVVATIAALRPARARALSAA